MKKLILSASALAALSFGGTALAQDAECNAGSAWGTKPGCGPASVPHEQYRGNSGWEPPYWGYPGYRRDIHPRDVHPRDVHPRDFYPRNVHPRDVHPRDRGEYAYVLPDGRVVTDPRGTAYRPSRRDRDGDGVRNNRDRYPDDPRYR